MCSCVYVTEGQYARGCNHNCVAYTQKQRKDTTLLNIPLDTTPPSHKILFTLDKTVEVCWKVLWLACNKDLELPKLDFKLCKHDELRHSRLLCLWMRTQYIRMNHNSIESSISAKFQEICKNER